MHRSVFNNQERGQGLVEYSLILVLVAVVTIVVLAVMGPAISDAYCEMVVALGGSCDSGGEEVIQEEPEPQPEEKDCSALKTAYDDTVTAYAACGGQQTLCPSEYNASVNAWHAWIACENQ